ncbi:L-tyrosine/L-tryptophan isonitrile synthase family protein [Streptomyces sp. CJ_13]|uniref:L-tyrosine/L-tryptophan isonitrile synthase family protein n=1 Tax=Streptomyces sp. CJ_13 TaxID=2724943 RepID=UPI00202A1614|nr:L-tyrosine/L-tryptophan isonitrile synthase family protein [Streptomyces sp. CJ_13]
MQPQDATLLVACLARAAINLPEFLKDKRKHGLDQAETVLAVLAHQKFQMNPVTDVRSEVAWQDRIRAAIEANREIEVVYPQFCVIPNAPKRYTNMGFSAGEDCTIEFIKLINSQVKAVYPPGIRVHAIADAALYGSAFHTHQTEVDAYFESVEQRIQALNAANCVSLHDYAEVLRTKCRPDYQVQYYEIGHQVWKGKYEALLPDTDLETLRRSVRASVNTRRFQLSHKDHLQLFGPISMRNTAHPYHDEIETMTDIAFKELITIRLACGAIDIASRLWPQALRATCHKGPKNGRWALGLKPYPEYYGACKLLPYHGMPLITKDRNGQPRLEIKPEVLLRGRDDLVRVTSDGNDEVWAYVVAELDEELGEFDYDRFQGMRVGENYPPRAYR